MRNDSDFDFGLGETADLLRTSAGAFADERIAPLAERIDREDWFPRELWPEMGALGLHGITVEEEWGGSGLGYSSIASPWRRFRARPPRSGSPTAPIPTSASTSFAAGVAMSRSGAACPG